jgi:hypothetical protein
MIAIQEWDGRPTLLPLYGLKNYFCFVFEVLTEITMKFYVLGCKAT